jgi:SSS family solute:Na+ symporter
MLSNLDYLIFLVYFVGISAYGFWIYRRKQTSLGNAANDYFLAEGSLTWWAIGASLIASNISAEQFIGMSGSGFAMGLAIASYEWMAAATLIIVAVFFLPIYLKNKIYTMPQFLKQRYDGTVALIMAVFWLFVFVFVNLTAILYLGALAINTISGIPFTACIIGLSIFAVFITLGGMKVIGYTDVIQVIVLIAGGLMTTYIALGLVNDKFGGEGIMTALGHLNTQADSHFHMIFSSDNPYYKDMPGISVLIGGMWIANLYYWGCNQYITQRALGADLKTGRQGLLFAAFLKLLMPMIVVIPGIAAYVLYQNGAFQTEMLNEAGELKPDRAYPVLLNLLPSGIKGLSFAALTAAIVASLAGKANSISTIFSLDIYRNYINKTATDEQVVKVGKIVIIVAMVVAAIVCPALGAFEQGFQFIQEFTGFVSPGAFAIFFLGFFWKKATSRAALAAALMTFPMSMYLKAFHDGIPFLNRMGIVFLLIVAMMVMISLIFPEPNKGDKIEVERSMFKVDNFFAVGSVIVFGLLAALYLMFW